MPAWPGGPCPSCGEDIPANTVSCRNCRALLNTDLVRQNIDTPEFVPLPEIGVLADMSLEGAYMPCPHCREELKVKTKYVGEKVECKHCATRFRLKFEGDLLEGAEPYGCCPHCEKRLRFASKYIGHRVVCKYCNGRVRVLDFPAANNKR